jgi:hypothetical protein
MDTCCVHALPLLLPPCRRTYARTRAGGKQAVPGLPPSFWVRPAIDPSLCVFSLDLASERGASAVDAALLLDSSASRYRRTGGGRSYGAAAGGGARLVLLPCSTPGDSSFTAEVVPGGYYFNTAAPNPVEGYRQALVRTAAAAPGTCWYGANATYTDGLVGGGGADDGDDDGDGEAEWVDEYFLDFAPYFNYNLTGAPTNTTAAAAPLPANSGSSSSSNATAPPATVNNNTFDATSWGPFRTGWGPCTSSPSYTSASMVRQAGFSDACVCVRMCVRVRVCACGLPCRLPGFGFE